MPVNNFAWAYALLVVAGVVVMVARENGYARCRWVRAVTAALLASYIGVCAWLWVALYKGWY
jgi:hypothetical protein